MADVFYFLSMYIHNGVADASWQKLISLAAEVKKTAHWDWLYDSDLVGIQHPETGEYYYCSIMGASGEHYAVALYQDRSGLYGLWKTSTGSDEWENPVQMLAYQQCLMLEFDNADEMEKADKQQLKRLGFSFRGANAYPVLKKHDPFMFPWQANQQDVDFFILALENLLPLLASMQLEENPMLCEETGSGLYNMPVLHWDKDTAAYRLQMTIVNAKDFAWPVKYKQGSGGAKTLLQVKDRPVFFIASIIPGPVQETKEQRPHFPLIFLLFDAETGTAVHYSLFEFNRALTEGLHFFSDGFEAMRYKPSTVYFSDEKSSQFLEPAAAMLGFKTKKVEFPPFVFEFLDMMGGMGM